MGDVLRTTASVALMVRLGTERGVTVERALRGTGLTEDDLGRSDPVVARDQELAVVVNLVDALDDPIGLGAEAGSRYHLTTYGIWGYALISSPTLRSAIGVGLRFLDLTFALSRISLHEEGDEARLVFEVPDVPARVRRFVLERDASAALVIQQEIGGGELPLRRFGFGGEVDLDARQLDSYAHVLDAEVDADAPEAYAAFDRELLDLHLPQSDSRTTTEAQEQCRALLSARRVREGEAARVGDVILARLSEGPDVVAVAADLHVSPRTLQRRLTAEGTSYRALLEEVRQSVARDLLAGGLSVAAVSERLGYAEVSSFSQAFRRWEGRSPTQAAVRP